MNEVSKLYNLRWVSLIVHELQMCDTPPLTLSLMSLLKKYFLDDLRVFVLQQLLLSAWVIVTWAIRTWSLLGPLSCRQRAQLRQQQQSTWFTVKATDTVAGCQSHWAGALCLALVVPKPCLICWPCCGGTWVRLWFLLWPGRKADFTRWGWVSMR